MWTVTTVSSVSYILLHGILLILSSPVMTSEVNKPIFHANLLSTLHLIGQKPECDILKHKYIKNVAKGENAFEKDEQYTNGDIEYTDKKNKRNFNRMKTGIIKRLHFLRPIAVDKKWHSNPEKSYMYSKSIANQHLNTILKNELDSNYVKKDRKGRMKRIKRNVWQESITKHPLYIDGLMDVMPSGASTFKRYRNNIMKRDDELGIYSKTMNYPSDTTRLATQEGVCSYVCGTCKQILSSRWSTLCWGQCEHGNGAAFRGCVTMLISHSLLNFIMVIFLSMICKMYGRTNKMTIDGIITLSDRGIN